MCYRDNLIFFLKKRCPRVWLWHSFAGLDDADAGKVTAAVILEVINECPFDLISETYLYHAETAGQRGVLLFNHISLSPLRISEVRYPVTDPQITSLRHTASIARRRKQGNKKQPCSNPGELLWCKPWKAIEKNSGSTSLHAGPLSI